MSGRCQSAAPSLHLPLGPGVAVQLVGETTSRVMLMYDVIVCGAGPAGATAARVCAERGLSVLMLDAARLPRDKVCAGGLTGAALAELQWPLPDDLVECSCALFRAVWFGETADVLRDHAYTVSVDRAAFDYWLVEAALSAGARLRDGERLTQLVRGPDWVLAITQRGYYRAQAVIGCDGANSAVARSAGLLRQARPIVLTASAEVPAADDVVARICGGGLRVEYGNGPVGYSWALPKRSRINIGLGALGMPGPELGRRLARIADSLGLSEPRPRFHVVPLGHQRVPLVADRVLLAGDAGALADPFTGEGIRYALASGRLAGTVLADTLVRGEPPERPALAVYANLCSAWRADFEAAWRLTDLIGRRARLVQRLVFDNRQVLQWLVDIADGTRTHRRFYRDMMLHLPLLALGSARAALSAGRRVGEAGTQP